MDNVARFTTAYIFLPTNLRKYGADNGRGHVEVGQSSVATERFTVCCSAVGTVGNGKDEVGSGAEARGGGPRQTSGAAAWSRGPGHP
jgi:hypothetical protein